MKWLAALVVTALAFPAHAIERIRLRAASAGTTDITLSGIDATLQIVSATRSTLAIDATRLNLPTALSAQAGAITDLHLRCTNPVVKEPLFACPKLSVQAKSSRWPALSLDGKVSFRSDNGAITASGGGIRLAGAPLQFDVKGPASALEANLSLHGFAVTEARKLIEPYYKLPADLVLSGQGDLDATVTQANGGIKADITLALRDAGFQNTDYTWIGEKLAISAKAQVDPGAKPMAVALQLQGTKGQALIGPVLLDFDKNPLQLAMNGTYDPAALRVLGLTMQQRDLAAVTATAEVSLTPFAIKAADITASKVRFPGVYDSYLKLTLATTPFNQLTTSGGADAQITVRDNLPTALTLHVKDLAFSDSSRTLNVTGVNSDLYWTAGATGPPRPSSLSWESAQGWGIVGARSRLDFATSDRNFRLLNPARLPFFDGALIINTLAAENLGRDDLSGVFDAVVEPISIGLISKAMGWPEFSGKLAGRIPGLTYKDQLLSLQGNLEAEVFDGTVVASNLRVREPLSAWPRLLGDIVARNLDLDLITRTFEFGSITGRLDVDLTGLETFNWSPVAFDLKLATPRDDRSKHRISQRAVQNLSDIGGGGGGVAAALQSGALKFFDDFGYDRIGLSCQLRRDVCLMGGAGEAKTGFYIVKGRGLPRIDIIGNNTRVAWPQLMTQVTQALANPGAIDVK